MFDKQKRRRPLALFAVFVMATLCLTLGRGGEAFAKDYTNSTSSPSSVTIYTDASHSTKLDTSTGSITADQTLYGTWHIDIAQADRPDLSDPVIEYTFPSDSINVVNNAGGTLYDNGTKQGTWKIEGNKIVITLDTDWLSTVSKNFEANVEFDFTLADQNVDEEHPAKVNFGGSAGSMEIPVKEKDVSASKSCTFDPETQTVEWTVTLNATSQASNVTVTDTIGSNLSFVDGSFKLDGQTVSATTSGQTATVVLGTLAKGEHKLTYSTTVSGADKVDVASGKLSDVNNKADWSWGKDGNHKNPWSATSDGPDISYKMVSKGNGTADAEGNVSWTVTLNSGNLKSDMGGYVFTDTLDGNQLYNGTYTVTAADGTAVSGTIGEGAESFTYTFPANAGKQSYTITYTTKYKEGVASKTTVKNTATVTKDGKEIGSSTGSYTGADNSDYITKDLVNSSSDTANGLASWTSTIAFSEMLEKPASATFTDNFYKGNTWTGQNATFTIAGVTAKDVELVAGTDYTVNNPGNASYFSISFTETGLNKLFALGTGTDVTVSYTTQLPEGSYSGTFYNTANIAAGSINQSVTKTYAEEGNHPMSKAVASGPTWDASYQNADGTTGAFITTWTVYLNRTSASSWQQEADLHGATITVTDDLANMSYVEGSASYTLVSAVSGEKSEWSAKSVAPTFTKGGAAQFAVDTSSVVDDNGSWHGWAVLTYKTAVSGSDVKAGDTIEFTNNVTAKASGMDFDGASATATVKNDVVNKASKYNETDALVEYTVNVNPRGFDLNADSDTLTLTDTLSATGTFQPGSFKVYDANGNELSSSKYSVAAQNVTVDGEVKTKITVVVPDGQALKVCYSVKPTGTIGQTVTINNNAQLAGYENSGASNSIDAKVANAKGSVVADSDIIKITKYDQANISKKLEGAQFTLYTVKLDTASQSYSLEPTLTATTGADGVAQFGTSEKPLTTDILYCIKETKAPAGYKASDAVYYVVVRSGADDTLYNQVIADAKTCGITETISTGVAYNYFDEESTVEPVEAKINITKTVNGKNPQEDETFTFQLQNLDGTKVSGVEDVTTAADGTATFEGLTFTEAGTYTYKVHETSVAGNGWTNADDFEATVTVEEVDGQLVATVNYGEGKNSFFVDNTYAAKPADVTFKISKAVIGDDAQEGEQFKFELQDESGNKVDEVTCAAGETKSFDNVPFAEAGTYTYKIVETSDLGEGWTNETGDVTATVTVSDARDGQLTATVEYTSHLSDDATVALITNRYTKPNPKTATTTINVSKTVAGDNAKADEKFTFELQDENGNKIEGVDAIELVADQTASFGTLELAEGTYTYIIHETSDNGAGWTNAQDITATVTVEAGEDGNLVASVEYSTPSEDGDSAWFVNEYEQPTATANINITKTVNGANPQEGEKFQFTLRPVGDAPMPEGESSVIVETTGAEVKGFGDITFTEVGEFTYTIKETMDKGEGWTDVTGSITATVKVSADEAGNLTATVDYGSTADKGAYVYNNEYTKPAEATIDITKTVNGENPQEDETFTFELLNEDGSRVLGVDEVTTKADGTASFEGLTFTEEGTHTYKVHETSVAGDGWTNADDFTVTVTVSKDGDALVATVDYGAGNNSALMDNTYTAKNAGATISVSKTINGDNPTPDEEFTFDLYNGTEKVDSVNVKGGASATYKELSFDKAGIYTYTIKETAKLGWTNETGDVTATVTVTKAENGRDLVASVEYSSATEDKSSALFTNKYTAEGAKVTLGVSKTINGDNPTPDEEFTFDLYNGTEKVDSVNVKGGASATYKELSFDKAGIYTYTIKETAKLGWTNETGDVTATVTVTQNEQTGNFEASVVYSSASADKSSALFTNKYTAESAKATISVSKEINGANPNEDETFEFTLYDGDEAKGTVNVKGGATASFADLSFDKAGTYAYTIKETAKLGWTNETGDVTATVTVTQNEETGNFEASVVYSNASADKSSALFTNKFTAASTTLDLSKEIAGDEALETETFEFTIKANDGAPAPEQAVVTTQGAGTASFGKVEFTQTGTYTYTISETGNLSTGWTRAGDVTATVTVGERDNALVVTSVVYSSATDDGSAAKFVNVYAPASDKATIDITKTVNGANPKEGEQFSFELSAIDGAPMPKTAEGATVTTTGAEVASFGEIEFEHAGTYRYTIHETTKAEDLGDGWTIAGDIEATVTVVDKGGMLQATVVYGDSITGKDAYVFNNEYAPAPKSTTIDITKTVNGENPQEGETFTFELLNEDGTKVEGVDVVTTKSDGTASFEGLTFTEEGTYKYKIHETSEDGNGWTNADDFDVTVTVTDDRAGNLTVTVDYNGTGENRAFIDNKYEAKPAEATIDITKTVNGANPKEGEKFTFDLVDKDGKVIDTVTVEADGKASFGKLTLTKAGTYTYTIHETSDLGEGWTNAPDVTATITVTDDRQGQLHATVSYTGEGKDSALFDNKYEEPKKPSTPETPSTPGTTTGGKTTTTKSATPQTGDATSLSLLASLALAGSAALAGGLSLKRRQR